MEVYVREMFLSGGSSAPGRFIVGAGETLEQLLERAGKPAHLYGVMLGGREIPPNSAMTSAFKAMDTIDVWPRPKDVSGGTADTHAASAGAGNPYGQQAAAPTGAGGNPYGQQAAAPTGAGSNPYGQQATASTGAGGNPYGKQATTALVAGGNPYGQQATTAPAAGGNPYGQQAATAGAGGAQTPQRTGSAAAGQPRSAIKGPARAAAPPASAAAGPQGGFMHGSFLPVSDLSAYSGRNWRIKARVITKSDIRKFNNARGESQFFKADLKDQSGEISAVWWGKACEKFFAVLKPGQVYSFSKGYVKAANPRFDKGSFTLSFEETSLIEEAPEDVLVPRMQFAFRKLCDLGQLELGTLVDVQAVVYSPGECMTFTAKNSGREMTKRDVGLWDPSGPPGQGSMADLTLWGDKALGSYEAGTVVFLKDARVSEWQNTRNLSSPAALEINPDKPDARTLKAQYEDRQLSCPIQAEPRAAGGGGGRRQTVQDAKAEDAELASGAVYRHSLSVTITSAPGDRAPTYPSCPALVAAARPGPRGEQEQRACQKKVTDEGGVWRCAMDHQSQAPVYRYISRINLMDHTDQCEVNFFDKEGRALYGMDADEITRAWGEGRAEQVNQRVLFKKVMVNARSVKELWNDSERVKMTLDSLAPLDFSREGRSLLAEVNAALAQR